MSHLTSTLLTNQNSAIVQAASSVSAQNYTEMQTLRQLMQQQGVRPNYDREEDDCAHTSSTRQKGKVVGPLQLHTPAWMPQYPSSSARSNWPIDTAQTATISPINQTQMAAPWDKGPRDRKGGKRWNEYDQSEEFEDKGPSQNIAAPKCGNEQRFELRTYSGVHEWMARFRNNAVQRTSV